MKEIFKANSYPKHIVDKKIEEIKLRNFGTSPNRIAREEEKNDPEKVFYSLSLTYTSFKCSKIASEIYGIIRKYTPKFRLNLCFRTLTPENIILPRLKPEKHKLFTPNAVYRFVCTCGKKYIGETSKIFKTRIFQHRIRKDSWVYKHTTGCEEFQASLILAYGSKPSAAERRLHIIEHFEFIKKNLPRYYERVTFEGLMITLENPDLNKQVYHRSAKLIQNFSDAYVTNHG